MKPDPRAQQERKPRHTVPAASTRRRFLLAGAALASFHVIPRRVLGAPGRPAPNARVTLAGIGVGGVGSAHLPSLADAGFEVVALCDLDDEYARKVYDKFPDARRYRDFRELLGSESDKVDAVYVGTPDHTHAIIALAALARRKHVICVKPLTRTIEEARVLAGASVRAGVATQMTASSAVMENGCRTCEMIWDGVAGDIVEVHIWSDRPLWPQGMNRPPGTDPLPPGFDWELWLGPAPRRPFKREWPEGHLTTDQIATRSGARRKAKPDRSRKADAVYHPWNFRGWHDFGTGALGDMGCHHFNTPRRALKLGHPTAVSATCTCRMEETWPLASIVTWEFPPRDGMPALNAIWYDGGLRPARPAALESGRDLGASGILYVGTKGTLFAPGTDGVPRLIPESKMTGYRPPAPTLARRPDRGVEWIEEIRGGSVRASQNWAECAGPLTELVLLGDIALRCGGHLLWDGATGRFTNSAEANALLKADYRNGWKLA